MSSPDPNLADLPRRVDRRGAAEIITKNYFPVSARTLERAPLTWRHVNGKAICETAEALEWARAKLDGAAPIRGGRRRLPEAA